MRDRKVELCPSCGSKFKIVPNSERHVRIGVWYEVQCPNCGLRKDAFYSYLKKPENDDSKS